MNAEADRLSNFRLTTRQARRVDRIAVDRYAMNTLVLMENAGRGAATAMLSHGLGRRAVIACGKGNNAGDGFVVARHLANAGVECRLWLVAGTEFSPDAAVNFEICRRMGLAIVRESASEAPLDFADFFVDALLGTGATGPPREPIAGAIRRLNESARPIAALDVPSGLDGDTGAASDPCIRARLTCTFVAPKVGFAKAEEFVGKLETIDIGVPQAAVAAAADEPAVDSGP